MCCFDHHDNNSSRQFPNKDFLLIITRTCRNGEGLSFHWRSTQLIWYLLPHRLICVHKRRGHHQLLDHHLHFGDFVVILRDWVCPSRWRTVYENLASAGWNRILRSTPPGKACSEWKMSRCGPPTNETSDDWTKQFARQSNPNLFSLWKRSIPHRRRSCSVLHKSFNSITCGQHIFRKVEYRLHVGAIGIEMIRIGDHFPENFDVNRSEKWIES